MLCMTMRRLPFIFHGTFGAQTVAADKNEKVSTILFSEDGVEKWIGTRVEWIKGDEQNF